MQVFPILSGNSWSLLFGVFFLVVLNFYSVLHKVSLLSARVTLDPINFQHNQSYGR